MLTCISKSSGYDETQITYDSKIYCTIDFVTSKPLKWNNMWANSMSLAQWWGSEWASMQFEQNFALIGQTTSDCKTDSTIPSRILKYIYIDY